MFQRSRLRTPKHSKTLCASVGTARAAKVTKTVRIYCGKGQEYFQELAHFSKREASPLRISQKCCRLVHLLLSALILLAHIGESRVSISPDTHKIAKTFTISHDGL